MIKIDLKQYQSIEFQYHTGTRYVALIQYDYGHIWKLKILGVSRLIDALRYDDDLYHSQLLAVTHRDLLEGELHDFVAEEINKRFNYELECVPF